MTLSLGTAYRSFGGEVEASSTPTICRLPDSRRHQLWAIARLSRPRSTVSQSDFHPVIRPFSPLRLGRSYKLAPEPDGSPLFALLPLVACWRYEPRERLRPLALSRPAVPPSPLSDRGRLL